MQKTPIIIIIAIFSAGYSSASSESGKLTGEPVPGKDVNRKHNASKKNMAVKKGGFEEKRPGNLGFIFTRTGPRFLFRHYFENRLGFQISFTHSSTELQSSYRGGAAILLTIAKPPLRAKKQRRLYLAVNIDLDYHAQYMKEYYDGDIRDRTDERLISELIPALGISIGDYVPVTFEAGFALSKYTTFDGSGIRKYRDGMHYAISLAYALNFKTAIKKAFGR